MSNPYSRNLSNSLPNLMNLASSQSFIQERFETNKMNQFNARKSVLSGYLIVDKTLHFGRFSNVCLAIHRSTMVNVVIKKIDKKLLKSEFDRKMINAEIEFLKRIDHHENIVKLLQFAESEENIYMVHQYYPNGNLESFLKRISAKSDIANILQIKMQIFNDIVQCLLDIQENYGLYHGSIKPSNILIDNNNRIKLIGFCPIYLFGSINNSNHYDMNGKIKSNNFIRKLEYEQCGLNEYQPPECWPLSLLNDQNDNNNNIETNRIYMPTLDVWSCGILLYQLLTNQKLFTMKTMMIKNMNIVKHIKRILNQNQSLSYEQIDLIEQMLNINPIKRLRMKEILRHSYMQKILSKNSNNDVDTIDFNANMMDTKIKSNASMIYSTADNNNNNNNNNADYVNTSFNETLNFNEINNDNENTILNQQTLDKKILIECLRLHGNEVNDILELRSNILHKYSYHTATYWLIQQNIHYYNKQCKLMMMANKNNSNKINNMKINWIKNNSIESIDHKNFDDQNEFLLLKKDQNCVCNSKFIYSDNNNDNDDDDGYVDSGLLNSENNGDVTATETNYNNNKMFNFQVQKHNDDGNLNSIIIKCCCRKYHHSYFDYDDDQTTSAASTTTRSNDSQFSSNEEWQNVNNGSKSGYHCQMNDDSDSDNQIILKKKSLAKKLLSNGLTKKLCRINSLFNLQSQQNQTFSLQNKSRSCTNSPCKNNDSFDHKSMLSQNNEHRFKNKNKKSIIYSSSSNSSCSSSSSLSPTLMLSKMASFNLNDKNRSLSTLIITNYNSLEDCINSAIHILREKDINFEEITKNYHRKNGTRQFRCCISTSKMIILVFRMDIFQTDPQMFILIRMKKIHGHMNDFQIICTEFTKYFQTNRKKN